MHSKDDIDQIEELLKSEGFSIYDRDENSITVKLSISDYDLCIRGVLVNDFPLVLPQYFLLNRQSFGRLAHVGWRDEDIGEICGGISTSLNINYESPQEVFLYGLQFVINTIKEPLLDTNINNTETLLEFNGHWRFTHSHKNNYGIALLEPSQKIYPFKVTKRNNVQYYFVKESLLNPNYSLNTRAKESLSSFSHKGLYIPFFSEIFPPTPNQAVHEWWLNDALSNIGDESINIIKNYIRNPLHKSKRFSIIASITLKQSQVAWIGLEFKSKVKSIPPLLKEISKDGWDIIPFTPCIHSQDHLLPRGGANNNLSTGSILLVGCGSIGSEVARLLAHSGIGRIDLLDYDVYETNNIYRHTLSSIFIGTKKTEALKYELQNKFPYLDVEVVKDYQKLSALCDKEKFLNKYDGVIVATGDPTEERFFNQKLFEFSKRPWVIYTWVEGYGVGGHSIYVHNDMKGCLSCLYKDSENELPSLHNIQNFMRVNQPFAVDIEGCGTHFLPFSHVDSVQTATLATRMATDALLGNMTESKRASWKGVDIEAIKNNLKLTRRYYKHNGSMTYQNLIWDSCPICRVN